MRLHEDGIRRVFHDSPKPFLTRPQRLLRLLALGDVLVGSQNADDPAAGARQRNFTAAHPAPRAVRANHGPFQAGLCLAGFHHLAVVAPDEFGLLLPGHLGVAAAHNVVLRGEVGIGQETAVAAEIAPVPVLPEHAHRDGVQDQLEHPPRVSQFLLRPSHIAQVGHDEADALGGLETERARG